MEQIGIFLDYLGSLVDTLYNDYIIGGPFEINILVPLENFLNDTFLYIGKIFNSNYEDYTPFENTQLSRIISIVIILIIGGVALSMIIKLIKYITNFLNDTLSNKKKKRR